MTSATTNLAITFPVAAITFQVLCNLVSFPDLIPHAHQLQYDMILKAISVGAGFGSGTEIMFNCPLLRSLAIHELSIAMYLCPGLHIRKIAKSG